MPVRRELEAALSASAGVSMQPATEKPLLPREGEIMMQLATLAAQMQIIIGQGGLVREVKEQALRDAAFRGDCAAVTRMLANEGVRIDAADATNWATPLHLAASRGHAAAVEVLLAAGASGDAALRSKVSSGSDHPLTILEHAVNGRSAHVVSLLLADETSTLLSLAEKQGILSLAAEASLDVSHDDVFGILAKADAFSEAREGAEKFLVHALKKAATRGNMQLVDELLAFAPALEEPFSCDIRWEAIDVTLKGSFFDSRVVTLQNLLSYPHCESSVEALERTRAKFSYEHFRTLVVNAAYEGQSFARKIAPTRAPLVQVLFAEMAPPSRVLSLARSEENKNVVLAQDLSGSEQFRVELPVGQTLSASTLSGAVGDACSRFGLAPRIRIFESERELSGLDCETVDRLEHITIEIGNGVDLRTALSKFSIPVSELRTLVDNGDIEKVLDIVCKKG